MRWWSSLWEWAGRVDDALGRWRVIRWLLFIVGGAFLVGGVLLVNAFGLGWSALILAGLAAIAFGIVGLVRDRTWRPVPPDQPPAARGPEPHDPGKSYGAVLAQEVIGEGRFRYLASSLHDVGNGWDRGVELEVERPSGKLVKVGGWLGLDAPATRRALAQGQAVRAEEPGPYVIRWRSVPLSEYESEVIAEEVITLERTGPLEGWIAHHANLGEEVMFQVDRDSPGRGLVHGFKCEIWGPSPGVPFEADDRRRESAQGNIIIHGLPREKGQGSFTFPNDFSDAPALRDLRDGDYKVYWTAWAAEESVPPIDVAHDAFHVDRTGYVDSSSPGGGVGVPGWESTVTGVTRNDRDNRLVTIHLKLDTPGAKQSDEEISAELKPPSKPALAPVEARWRDHNLHEGEAPHYSLFFPIAFPVPRDEPIDNGWYVLKWRQRHGASWRYVTDPHLFEIRNGELMTDV